MRPRTSRAGSSMAVLQHERFVLWVLCRYLPFVAGAVIALLFGASVLHDTEDIAHTSWSAGGDMLGTFADLGRALLIPLFVGSALLRRGTRRILRITRIDPDGLHAEDEAGRPLRIPRHAVRSAFRYARGEGTDTVVLELSEGLFLAGLAGDRLSLTVERDRAAELMAVFASETTDVCLSTRSPRLGGFVAAASIVLGTLLGALAYRWLHHAAMSLPPASYYIRIVPDAETGWLGGLIITSMGLVHAALSLGLRTPPIVLHPDVVEIRGARHVRIPIARIASVEVSARALTIELDDEERYSVAALAADREKLAGIALLIRERLAARSADREVPSGLERGALSVGEWRRAIEARAAAPRYRVGAIDPDALPACISSPTLPRDIRVGAALALSADPDPARRVRLREIAQEVGPPSLRALALELAEGEAHEETIVRALRRKRAV